MPDPGPDDDLFKPLAASKKPAVEAALAPSFGTQAVHAQFESTVSFLARQAVARELLNRLLPLAESTGHRVVWVSTLDHRTTPYCQQMHGRAHGDGWEEPPPAHHNYRSRLTLVPAEEYVAPSPIDEPLPRPDAHILSGPRAVAG